MKIFMTLMLLCCVISLAQCQETRSQQAIKAEMKKSTFGVDLRYPQSVKRFYRINNFNYAWIKPKAEADNTWAGMLLLDCVLQFGLNQKDYHPEKFSYDSLRMMINEPQKIGEASKAQFELLLTDALITFVNHLHYGKLNPEFTEEKIDKGGTGGFNAESVLIKAIAGKEFMRTILNVQPKVREYEALQSYMRLIKGQYVDDCYEVPEAEARKIAINMERLRWININSQNYIMINIPSYSLALHEKDTTYDFKVIVGSPENQTPVLNSILTHITTGPERRVSQVVFEKQLLPQALKNSDFFERHHYDVYDKKGKYIEINSYRIRQIKNNPSQYFARQSEACDNSLGNLIFQFHNRYGVYLHDSPTQGLFDRDLRAISHRCIRIQQAGELAELLLKYDGSGTQVPLLQRCINNYQRRNFMLKNPIPIRVTYLTCKMNEGLPVFYKDIYHLDESLENQLYGIGNTRIADNL